VTATQTTRRRTTGHVGLWILQIIAALMFLVAALGKFADVEPAASTFDAIGFGDWFRDLVGVLELAGLVALLIPRLTGLAALAFVGLMTGATVTELLIPSGGVALPFALLVVCGVIAWGRRESTTELWALLRR
jgi:putative oxidoreductase